MACLSFARGRCDDGITRISVLVFDVMLLASYDCLARPMLMFSLCMKYLQNELKRDT